MGYWPPKGFVPARVSRRSQAASHASLDIRAGAERLMLLRSGCRQGVLSSFGEEQIASDMCPWVIVRCIGLPAPIAGCRMTLPTATGDVPTCKIALRGFRF